MTTQETTAEGLNRRTEARRLHHDQMFDLLSNHRRRYTLQYLRAHDTQAELGDLAEQVAAWETGCERPVVSADARKRVYTALQQFHLPRMDDAGLVEFDDRAGVVSLGPDAETVDVYLEVVEGRDVPWSLLYLGLAALNGVLLVGAFLDIVPLTSLSPGGVAIFATTTFALSAAIHAYDSHTQMRLGTKDHPPEVGD